MKQILLITVVFFLIEPIIAQTNKFGEITKEQWEIKTCNFDTASNFLYLFDIGTISVNGKEKENKSDQDCNLTIDYFALSFERHFRIKVLKMDEISPFIISIVLRSINGNKDRLNSFKGVLVKNENGKEVKSKFNFKSLTKKVNEDGSCIMYFEIPILKKGSILDISYMIESNIFNETPEWNFANDFASLYSEINISIPDFVACQKKCNISNKLSYESFNRKISYVVSFNFANNDSNDAIYKFDEIHEKYSLSNIQPSTKLIENYTLKYLFSSFNFYSVSCDKKVYKFIRP
jgi:ribosomal protein L19